MAAPIHLRQVSVGSEGPIAAIPVAGASFSADTSKPKPEGSNIVDKVKHIIAKDTIAEGHEGPILRAGQFGALGRENANRVVEVKDKEQQTVSDILSTWATWCLDEHGIVQDAGSLDKTVVSLYSTMIGLKPDERLTSEFLSKSENFGRISKLDFDKLSVTQIQQLMQVMKSAEIYMSAVIGMEIQPLPHQVDNTATGHAARLRQYAQIGLGWLSHKVSNMGDMPTSKYDNSQIEAKAREARQREINELFNNSPYASEAGSAGFRAFRNYVDRAMDPRKGLARQREFLLDIRQTRIRMVSQLSAGEIHPDSIDPKARELIDTIRLRDQYKEFVGQAYESLPVHVQQMMEADALLQLAQSKATVQAEELHERHMLETLTKGKLETLHEKIEKISKGPSASKEKIDQAKTDYESKLSAWRAIDAKIKNWQSEIVDINTNLPIHAANLTALRLREDNITTGVIAYPANPAGENQRLGDLRQVRADIKDEMDWLTKANKEKGEAKRNITTARDERKKAATARDSAKKEFDSIKGGKEKDKHRKDILEAIEAIVKEDGSRNELARRLLEPRNDPAANFTPGTNATESGINYQALRDQLGIKDEVFKDLVGANNTNLRLCLARILNLTFDEAQIKGAPAVPGGAAAIAINTVAVQALDEEIWKALRGGGNSRLVEVAKGVWVTMLDSANLRDEPTLDMGDTYNQSRPDLIRIKNPESPSDAFIEKVNTILQESNHLQPGVDTIADYVKLSSGEMVAVCVDENGRNFVIDQQGKNIGSLARMENVAGVWQTEPSTTEKVTKIQSEIQKVLLENQIRSNMFPGARRNSFRYIWADATVLNLNLKNGILMVGNQSLQDYLTRNSQVQEKIASESQIYLLELEIRGRELANRRNEVGEIKVSHLDPEALTHHGKGSAEWDDPTTLLPGPDYQNLRVILGQGSTINYQIRDMRRIGGVPLPTTAAPAPRDINSPPLADLNQVNRFMEGAFFHLTQLSSEERQKIAAYMPEVRLDNISNHRAFQIGLNTNGDLILRDLTDSTNLNPQDHNALIFLNDQMASGNLTPADLREIRFTLGRHYLFAENEHLRRNP